MERTTPHVPISLEDDNLCEGARKILELVRPKWEKNAIKFKLLTDGITNKLLACSSPHENEDDIVLIRIYGNKTDLLIDRSAETKNIILLNQYDLAPDLYATFNNGLSYEFIPGCTLNENTVTQPKIFKLVAKNMAKLHRVEITEEKALEAVLWKKMQKFFDLIPSTFTEEPKNKRYRELILPKERIQEEINFLKDNLSDLKSPVVFAHNDLLLGNVIYTADRNKISFIDFEYAAFNYQAYDIGNHFAEFAGIKSVDYSRYPKKELQHEWLNSYLSEYLGREPTGDEIERLYAQVNKFALASHVFWGVWALIQAEYSYIDFDFIEYAAIRLNEYFNKKDEFMSLSAPTC